MENLITSAYTETIVVDLRSFTVTMISSASCNDDECECVDNHRYDEMDEENGNILATPAEEGRLAFETSVNEGVVGDDPFATVASTSKDNMKDEHISVPDETGRAIDERKESEQRAQYKNAGSQDLILQNAEKNSNEFRMGKVRVRNVEKSSSASILISKSSTILLDVEPSPSPESHTPFTPESKREKVVVMNESRKREEKEGPEPPAPRCHLSLPRSYNLSQSLGTPLAVPRKRLVFSESKTKINSNVGLCSRKWNSRSVSSPQPCERCLKIHTTACVQKGFEMNTIATSPCVNKTRGGCSPSCGFFPRNILQGEKPVVLCRHCFHAVHRVLDQI